MRRFIWLERSIRSVARSLAPFPLTRLRSMTSQVIHGAQARTTRPLRVSSVHGHKADSSMPLGDLMPAARLNHQRLIATTREQILGTTLRLLTYRRLDGVLPMASIMLAQPARVASWPVGTQVVSLLIARSSGTA